MFYPAVISALIIGFLAGLFSFRVKARWCGNCGTTLNCPACMGAGAHRLPGAR